MSVTLVVGGMSELKYLTRILNQGHAWAMLGEYGIQVLDSGGDSKIPSCVQAELDAGRRVVVLLDNDALARAREQASVIERSDVPWIALSSDFEGAFDAPIVERALARLQFRAGISHLETALKSARPFEAIVECAQPMEATRPLDKVRLSETLAMVSESYWYLPREFEAVFDALGNQGGIDSRPPIDALTWVSGVHGIDARGRLFVCNHVSNDRVRFWDFESKASVSIALPERFDGSLAICRRGRRVIAMKYERLVGRSDPASTWIHVFDIADQVAQLTSRFRVAGPVSDVVPEEDGNHLQLCMQRENTKYCVRCLVDGTKRETVALPTAAEMYGLKHSRSTRKIASGQLPMKIESDGKVIALFPHFYAHSFVWSPSEDHLAFFARRWRKPPDFLWLFDLRQEQVHRMAVGEQHIPIYWT